MAKNTSFYKIRVSTSYSLHYKNKERILGCPNWKQGVQKTPGQWTPVWIMPCTLAIVLWEISFDFQIGESTPQLWIGYQGLALDLLFTMYQIPQHPIYDVTVTSPGRATLKLFMSSASIKTRERVLFYALPRSSWTAFRISKVQVGSQWPFDGWWDAGNGDTITPSQAVEVGGGTMTCPSLKFSAWGMSPPHTHTPTIQGGRNERKK